MKIVTLTLNPAFDIHCYVENFLPFHENLAKVTDREAGGKGVNISRALSSNKVQNLAVVVLGKENAEDFRKSLDSDKISYRQVIIDGRIRENITVHTNGAKETRISFSGFDADVSLLVKLEEQISDIDLSDTFLTFTGRVPTGLSIAEVKAFLHSLQDKGAKLVIDSRSFLLDDIIEMKPWLIKPNEEEIGYYLGETISSFSQVRNIAVELCEKGIENVMISLGEKGAMLVCRDGVFEVEPPKVEAISTIGAGDSAIAGFLAASVNGLSSCDRLCTAVAYGTAACLTAGTKPPKADDIDVILKKVVVR